MVTLIQEPYTLTILTLFPMGGGGIQFLIFAFSKVLKIETCPVNICTVEYKSMFGLLNKQPCATYLSEIRQNWSLSFIYQKAYLPANV